MHCQPAQPPFRLADFLKNYYSSTDESFPSLLRAELDQWSFAKEKAKHVGHDVIDHHHHDGHNEPDEAFKHILQRNQQFKYFLPNGRVAALAGCDSLPFGGKLILPG